MAPLPNHIKKRWVYHFIISPKTNLIDKPEWYLNRTLHWIHELIDSQETRDFILDLLELARMRLSKDVKTIGDDLALLTHTYNEVIKFTKVIRQLLGLRYIDLDEKHDLMLVFAQQGLFEKIDDVEWEYSQQKVSEITTSESKWDPVLEGDYLDYYKIPRCVDRFLLQIRSISERVDCFNQIDCKLRLIDLQCSLFNRFLKYLRQSSETDSVISNLFFLNDQKTIDLSHILRVLNGANFLTLVLKEMSFINPRVIDQLEEELKSKLDKTANEYKKYLNKLIDKVLTIYESTDCDLQKFLAFIKPKMSKDMFELVRDEASKIDEIFHTKEMLEQSASNYKSY